MEQTQTFDPTRETITTLIRCGKAKAQLPWSVLLIKSFLAGAFLSFGALFDILIAGGAPALRNQNPTLVTFISSFTFPTGFVILTIANTELFTANLFVIVFSTCLHKNRIRDLAKNLVSSYAMNLAGALAVAGFLCYWSDTLSSEEQKAYSIIQAEARVNVKWSANFLRGVGCNWLVGMAMFLSIAAKDKVSKVYAIWIPIWTFVALGYQHCIANFFLVPIGMFYGTDFGVEMYIYNSVIPVTIGNIVGGSLLDAGLIWFICGHTDAKAHMKDTAHLDRSELPR